MKQILKTLLAALACLLAPVKNMANEDAPAKPDRAAMLLKLLGLADDADDAMVNARFEEAMKAEPDEADKKLAEEKVALEEEKKAADEKLADEKVALEEEKKVANEKLATAEKAKLDEAVKTEKARADKLAQDFANERKERVKLMLDEAITSGRITKADREGFEKEFANVEAFDATVKKLAGAKSSKLPATRQAVNVGARRTVFNANDKSRRDKLAEMVNEESKKQTYRHLPEGERYSAAYTAVRAMHPDLWVA